MMVLNIKAILAIFVLAGFIRAERFRCPENEIYSRCVCPITCQDRIEPPFCKEPIRCTSGCTCIEGYVREGPGGRCVESCKGVPVCGEHEQFSPCVDNCPRICNQTEPSCLSQSECKSGCICEDGYVREKIGGRCIPEKECVPVCGENEEYKYCTSPCIATCSEPDVFCLKPCVNGCFCQKGYVREERSGKCIKIEDCPK